MIPPTTLRPWEQVLWTLVVAGGIWAGYGLGQLAGRLACP